MQKILRRYNIFYIKTTLQNLENFVNISNTYMSSSFKNKTKFKSFHTRNQKDLKFSLKNYQRQ